MKKRRISIAIVLTFVFLFSCDEYKTKVSNEVHADGSITRTVMMTKKDRKDFDPGKYLVPIDSTWNIEYSLDIDENSDTTWILNAQKKFESVEYINAEYETDSGKNQSMSRHADFSRQFRWFYTEYRYAETVEKILDVECLPDSFLTLEELKYFYLPESISENLKNGSDSIKYRQLEKNIETNMEAWFWTSLVQQWILNLHTLASENENYSLKLEELQAKEEQLLYYMEKYGENDDYFPDSIVKYTMGEKFIEEFQIEIDSAYVMMESKFETYMAATHYELEVCMPGKLTESNGFIVTNEELADNMNLLWSVSGEYFFTQDYVMWAESREKNIFAWVISGLFVLFVVTSLLLRKRKS